MWKYLSRATATTLYTLPGNGGRSLLIVYLYHFHRKLHSFTFIHSTACLKHFSSLSAIQLSAKVFFTGNLKVTDSALQTAVRNKIIFDLFLISRSWESQADPPIRKKRTKIKQSDLVLKSSCHGLVSSVKALVSAVKEKDWYRRPYSVCCDAVNN